MRWMLFALFDRVGLLSDCLPIAIHLSEGLAAQLGQVIIFSFGAIWGFCLIACYKSLFFESPENTVNCSFAYKQAFGLTKLSLYFIAVHSAIAYVIKDGQFEKSLADLVCPVIKKYVGHRDYDKMSISICQCHIALIIAEDFCCVGFGAGEQFTIWQYHIA